MLVRRASGSFQERAVRIKEVTQLGIMVVAASEARRSLLVRMLREAGASRGWQVSTEASLSVERFGRSRANILLADIASPEISQLFLNTVKELPQGFGFVAMIDDPEPRWVRNALHAGAHAIIARDADRDQLSLAVEAADAGYVLLHPTSARMLGSAVSNRIAVERPDTAEQLTAREREVLGLMSDGLGNKEIASHLGISEHTVKFHASSILGKLSASTRTEAVSQGIRRGLIAV
jgi:DNA-binding NarL/FixJ family response regulator